MRIKLADEDLDGLSAFWCDGFDSPLVLQVSLYRHLTNSYGGEEVAWTNLTVDEARKLRDHLNLVLNRRGAKPGSEPGCHSGDGGADDGNPWFSGSG